MITFKSYVQRELNSNYGVFPESKLQDHLTFLDYMQSELVTIASSMDNKTTHSPTFDENLNCTLDDVAVPESFLDDVSFFHGLCNTNIICFLGHSS